MKKKSLVQFDGSNFYNKVKKILPQVHLTNFDYHGLAKLLVKGDELHVVYYFGEIRQYEGNKKSEMLYSNQQKLCTHLRNQNIEIKLGSLLMSDGKFHEKGVDVQIAVDIVRGSIKNEYDKFYLISSDTDLLPAIQTTKDENKEIIYVGFENFISRALQKNCSSYVILKKDQILKLAKSKK
ncbi:MAG: NYN domain-containing protein [Nanoarchaeota archaeon]